MAQLPQWSLADRLRKIRRDRHLTQEEIAHSLGIKSVTWSSWEAGRNRPEDVLQLAQAIEEVYDVPAAWTLGVLYGRRSGDEGPFSRASVTADQWSRMANPVHERVVA